MLATLIKTGKTVFSISDINYIFPEYSNDKIYTYLYREKNKGLLNPKKGVWTLPVYKQEELVMHLFPGSYISLERVLFDVGVNFQRYGGTETVVRNRTTSIEFNDEHYISYKIKPEIYNNGLFIQEYNGIRTAMPERALCDLVYLHPRTGLDNPQYFQSEQSMRRFKKLLSFYPKTTQKNVMKLITQQI